MPDECAPKTRNRDLKPAAGYAGQRFGMVLVLGGVEGKPHKVWGRCDCGVEREFGKWKLVRGRTQSCGCLQETTIPPGTIFGKWTVGEKFETFSGGKRRFYYQCQCECGTVALRDGRTLRKGQSTSCGCERSAARTLPDAGASFRATLLGYRRGAAARGRCFDLGDDLFRALTQKECHYCGQPPGNSLITHNSVGGAYVYNGLDRQNSALGYLPSNVVTSCIRCNQMKRMRSAEEFLEWAAKVAAGPYVSRPLPLSERAWKTKSRGYLYRAKKRGLEWALTAEQFRILIGGSCFYCGAPLLNQGHLKDGTPFLYNGVDRMDNGLGYTLENCRSACPHCNRAKSDLSVEDFYAHVQRVTQHQSRATPLPPHTTAISTR